MLIINKTNNFKRKKLISEINITPMVDVMLVLLIIFMITAPMLTTGINIDLPKANNNSISTQEKPILITINNNKEFFINDSLVKKIDLAKKIKTLYKENKNQNIFLIGDQNVSYGTIIEIISLLHNIGLTKISLITKPKDKI